MCIYLVITVIASLFTICAIGIVYLLNSLIDDFKYYHRVLKRRNDNEDD